MRLTLPVLLSIVFAIILVAFGFAFYQSSTEKTKLEGELKIRTSLVSEAIVHNNSLFFNKPKQRNIERFADSVIKQYNLLGIAYYINNDSILSSISAKKLIVYSKPYVSK